ncbi:MAG: YlmH/Sll1252 family protein [Bacillota bacterium]|nr:YlmH/Sll1252 family protein [Bacillota bacterium]
MDETKLIISKTLDLADGCRKKYYPEFSKFLDIKQQAAVKNIKFPGCTYFSYGGYEDAERKVIGCFPNDYDYDETLFPISILKLTPSEPEGLTHRDYLGSLIGLGIKRECVGDIVINKDVAYLFCTEEIQKFILLNLKRIGNRSVIVQECCQPEIPEKKFKRASGTVASPRIDCVLGFAMNTSRSRAEEFIKGGKVMINYTETDSVSQKLKPGDTVSVRGFGKFLYAESNGNTKKGRLKIEIDIYS